MQTDGFLDEGKIADMTSGDFFAAFQVVANERPRGTTQTYAL